MLYFNSLWKRLSSPQNSDSLEGKTRRQPLAQFRSHSSFMLFDGYLKHLFTSNLLHRLWGIKRKMKRSLFFLNALNDPYFPNLSLCLYSVNLYFLVWNCLNFLTIPLRCKIPSRNSIKAQYFLSGSLSDQ